MRAPVPALALHLALAVTLLALPSPTSRAANIAPQGAALLKTDILGVFAHPDDETGMAATLARYGRGQGKTIAHAYVTRGEGGGNMVGTHGGPALGILRETELRDCLRLLGIRTCHFLEQEDFFYTESHAATLRKWNRPDALRRLVRLVRALRPEIIVTLNPAPNPGQHGHHQAAGVLATEAFSAAANPEAFPEQLREEGLSTWQTRKLFFTGAGGNAVTTVTTTEPLIDGQSPADIAGHALSHHRSQGFGGFANAPWLRRPQSFTLVQSVVPPRSGSTDLLEDLPTPEPVRVMPFAPAPTTAPLAFRPRPAIGNYLAWTAAQGIRHLTADFPADIPVVAGEPTPIHLDIAPGVAARLGDSLSLRIAPPWSASVLNDSDPHPHPGTRTLHVQAPPDALADAEIEATARVEGDVLSARARLHPVPLARVPRAVQTPGLDPEHPAWRDAVRIDVGTNRTWQGRPDSPADCSAHARLLHDDHGLWIDIEVLDDVVVSNIEPNDIRGHWRSDSVEICLDPSAGAEDTTGCFKLGIFPFDTAGNVRAARDADARQGPLETTAPGVRLASRRTPQGYRILASIPWESVVGQAGPPRRLGFNLLVYDGDKAEAARGENINRTRLAWSPRPGVQGRPEDWGRIDLD